eukprot:468382-Pyramimonas_sp.AAC.1
MEKLASAFGEGFKAGWRAAAKYQEQVLEDIVTIGEAPDKETDDPKKNGPTRTEGMEIVYDSEAGATEAIAEVTVATAMEGMD